MDDITEAKRVFRRAAAEILPSSLRSSAVERPDGALSWPLERAHHVVTHLHAAKAAIVEGTLWLCDADGRGPYLVPDADIRLRSHGWKCLRDPHEEWSQYVSRAKEIAMARVQEAIALQPLAAAPYVPRLWFSWATEEEQALFAVPEPVALLARQHAEHGQHPWGLISIAVGTGSRVHPIQPGSFFGLRATSLAGVPKSARFLHLDGAASDIRCLPEYDQLETLILDDPTDQAIHVIGELKSLRSLSLNRVAPMSLGRLAGLHHLEHLALSARSLPALVPLAALPRLHTLVLGLGTGTVDLQSLAPFTRLRGLALGGEGVWTKVKVPTIAPLANLTSLRSLTLLVRIGDQSLRPLVRLSKLTHLQVPAWFKLAEFALLAARFPSLSGLDLTSIWFAPPVKGGHSETACRTCGEYQPGLALGKPCRAWCPRCDEAKIARREVEWRRMVDEARGQL